MTSRCASAHSATHSQINSRIPIPGLLSPLIDLTDEATTFGLQGQQRNSEAEDNQRKLSKQKKRTL